MKDFDRVCIYVDSQCKAEDSFTVRDATGALSSAVVTVNVHQMASHLRVNPVSSAPARGC